MRVVWWVKSPSIIQLIILSIMLGSINQLLVPVFGPMLKNQGLQSHFGDILMVGSTSQCIAGLLTTPIVWRFGAKKTLVVALVGCTLVDCLWVVGIELQSPLAYYVQWGIGSGLGIFPITCSGLLLRTQLKQSQFIGSAITTFLMTVATASCNWLAFRAEPVVWAYTLVATKLILSLLALLVKSEADQPTKLGLRGMRQDPATKLAISSLPGLFLFFVVLNLLPISRLMTDEETGVFLMFSTLLGGVCQMVLAPLCNHFRTGTVWVIWSCRVAMPIGLILILCNWWQIGVVPWALGVSANTLIKSVSAENAKDKIVGNTLPMVAWSLAMILGSAYIWCADQMGYKLALWGMLLPAAVAILLTHVYWRQHQLPPNQEKEGES